jgi:hypothetical protein
MTENSTVKAKAAQMWLAFTESEKACVRLGMFPQKPMLEARQEGYTIQELSVAIMGCAKKNGGMIS